MHRTSKTTPCWYYNQEGRSCPQGSSCRFLHPNDPRWPRKMLSSRFQDGKRRNGDRDSASRTRRSAPLVPQSALFLLRESEELSTDARGRDSRHYSDGTKQDHSFIDDSQSTVAGRKDIEKDSPASRGCQTNSEIDNFGQEIIPKSHNNDKKLQRYSDTSRTQETKLELKGDLHPQKPGQFPKHSRAAVGLFRDLARLSREVDTLSEVQRKEEGNIKTYKQISATLESISASAATTIAPQLSRSLDVQADCKKVIDEKEKIMQRLWTDAVEGLVRDVRREVDVGLQAALLSIKQEARQVVYSTHKRQRDEEHVAHPEKIRKRDSNTMILEHKRRRGDSIDSSSDGLQGSPLDENED